MNEMDQQVEHLWPHRNLLGTSRELTQFGVKHVVFKQKLHLRLAILRVPSGGPPTGCRHHQRAPVALDEFSRQIQELYKIAAKPFGCAALVVLGAGATAAQQQAENNAQLAGTWKLISAIMEDVDTREQKLVWGEHPNGYIVLTPAGRWIVVQTAEGRAAPKIDEERSTAFRTMLAYSGKFRVEGNKVIIKGRHSLGRILERHGAGQVLPHRSRQIIH